MSKYVKILVPDDFDDDSVIRYAEHDETFPVYEPKYINVLDHGFVGLVDFMGDDSAIVNAARVSYGKGTKKVNTDRGLIRYLMRHQHSTPMEMCSYTFHIKLPIFVMRQLIRHRTASTNEYSARYSILDSEMYHPDFGELQPQSSTNRQGTSGDTLTEQEYAAVMSAVDHVFDTSYQTYLHILGPNENGDIVPPPDAIRARIEWCKDAAVTAVKEARRRAIESNLPDPYPTEESVTDLITVYLDQNSVFELTKEFPGVARELARIVLPVSVYTQAYWKMNLHNLFHFLKLRCDPHAQYQIRVYADAILELIEPHAPWAVEAFKDYLLNGAHLSRMEVEAIRFMLTKDSDGFGEQSTLLMRKLEEAGASKREITEFCNKFINEED